MEKGGWLMKGCYPCHCCIRYYRIIVNKYYIKSIYNTIFYFKQNCKIEKFGQRFKNLYCQKTLINFKICKFVKCPNEYCTEDHQYYGRP